MKIVNIKTLLVLGTLLISSLNVYAGLPRLFSSDDKSFFNNASYDGIMLTEKDELTLAPKITKMLTLDKYVWKLHYSSDGTIYAGVSGEYAEIYKINADDNSYELFIKAENDIAFTALTTDSKGNVYAATGPNGKVYKYDENAELIWETTIDDLYVWDIKLDNNDNIYLATGGDNARVLSVTEDGVVEEIITTDETHAVTLHYDNMKDTFYVGTSGRGLLLEIDVKNKSYSVIYDTAEGEVHTITTDNLGNIYFGTANREKSENILPSVIDAQNGQAQGKSNAFRNSLYKVDNEQVVQRLFFLTQKLVFSLSSDKNNDVYFITGDEANIYKIGGDDGLLSYIGSLKDKTLTTFTPTDDGIYFALTKVGEIYEMGHQYALEGTFTSEALNTAIKSEFGIFDYNIHNPSANTNTKIEVYTRTGNVARVDKTWSEFKLTKESKIESPPARFIQFKIIMKTDDENVTPRITSMYISYVPLNLAPSVLNLKLITFYEQQNTANDSIKRPQLDESKAMLLWSGNDPNKDSLLYTVAYRLSGEETYYTLATNLKTSYYTFDANAMAEGIYDFKVTVSDRLDNSIETAKEESFEIFNEVYDNVSPYIENFKSSENTIEFTVKDDYSIIRSVKYALALPRDSNWNYISSSDGLVDSKTEDFTLNLELIDNASSISIEVIDIKGNTRYYNFFIKP